MRHSLTILAVAALALVTAPAAAQARPVHGVSPVKSTHVRHVSGYRLSGTPIVIAPKFCGKLIPNPDGTLRCSGK